MQLLENLRKVSMFRGLFYQLSLKLVATEGFSASLWGDTMSSDLFPDRTACNWVYFSFLSSFFLKFAPPKKKKRTSTPLSY